MIMHHHSISNPLQLIQSGFEGIYLSKNPEIGKPKMLG
jgi:hypothetical protein